MSHFPDKLRLKEQADEDQYFARRERELIAALHARRARPIARPIARLVSGGQSGVDRAALDAALACEIPVGGWCPRGRGAEDGLIPDRYPLRETPDSEPAQRTAWNVRDSDATLILHRGPLSGGTALTAELARRYRRPLLQVDLETGRPTAALAAEIRSWLQGQGARVLNVAGPRESQAPGIGAAASALLRQLLGGSERAAGAE